MTAELSRACTALADEPMPLGVGLSDWLGVWRRSEETVISKKHEAAIEAQQYTPKFIAGVCGNCAHMRCDMELPAWMQKQPGVWDDKFKLEKNHRCGIGGFSVKKLGSCAEHAFAGEPQRA